VARPRRAWWTALAVAALLGMAVGLAGYTFVYAKGGSYLSNNPSACANCHVMAHRRRTTVTSIEELKALIEEAAS
jgi:nitrate/TMAO reductase-like tetraheme cytochrome c subunit